jgi:glycosyltransferase involved in cell wall biosynthesis
VEEKVNKQDSHISIVVPVYNEEKVIGAFLDELFGVMTAGVYSFEVILVDDGSTDNTVHIIKEFGFRYAPIKLISLTRNFGHQYALWAGIEKATGDAVIMMDADLQHPPTLIPELIEKWRSGARVVQTVRNNRGITLFKRVSSKLFYFFLNLFSDFRLSPSTADFCLIDKTVVKELLKFQESDVFLRGLIPWLGMETAFIKFNVSPRFGGKSKYSFFKMVKLAMTGVTTLSTLPLRFTTISGFIISFLSFYFGMEAIYVKVFTNKAVSGWASLMVGIFFIGGLSMIFMGILGEYIAKVFIEVKKRPRYVIKEICDFKDRKIEERDLCEIKK